MSWCRSSMLECDTKILGNSRESSTSLAPDSLAFLRERSSLQSSGSPASTCSFIYVKRHKCVLTSRSVLLRLSFPSQQRFNPPSCQALAAPALLQGFLSLFFLKPGARLGEFNVELGPSLGWVSTEGWRRAGTCGEHSFGHLKTCPRTKL